MSITDLRSIRPQTCRQRSCLCCFCTGRSIPRAIITSRPTGSITSRRTLSTASSHIISAPAASRLTLRSAETTTHRKARRSSRTYPASAAARICASQTCRCWGAAPYRSRQIFITPTRFWMAAAANCATRARSTRWTSTTAARCSSRHASHRFQRTICVRPCSCTLAKRRTIWRSCSGRMTARTGICWAVCRTVIGQRCR